MKKISISQLPLGTTLKGLFTLGTDENNNSVKISLTFVQDAADNANKAASDANTATNAANKATSDANTATNAANKAASDANKATSDAIAAETARKNSWKAWFEDLTTGVVAIWDAWFGKTKLDWNTFNTTANQSEATRVNEYATLREDIMEKTEAANNAANRVDESILDISTEKDLAIAAAKNANDSATGAKQSTLRANAASEKAEEVINRAEQAVTNANNATDLATEKIGDMNTGLSRLEELEATLTAKDRQQPTSMVLTYPKKITFGNMTEQRIKATLSPAGTGSNVLFLSDNRSVNVFPDGFIKVLSVGKSFVHAIPTENTAIYQTVEIEVLPTPIRKVTSTAMRLTSSGAMRFN